MKFVRIFSSIAYHFTRVLAWIYLLSTLYVLLTLILHSLLPAAEWVPVQTTEASVNTNADPRFTISIPFTEKPLFLGKHTAWGMVEIVVGMGLYGIFFHLLSRIFYSFQQEKLFTEQAVQSLMRFVKASFILPGSFLIFLYINPEYSVGTGEIAITFLHSLLGIFALFQAAIFKEGFTLQKEQDLTI